ncbi:MAG: UbiD family decarboxylase, partial [Anaerolineales bacterium]
MSCSSLRDYIHQLESEGNLTRITAPMSKTYQVSGALKQLEPAAVLFEKVLESPFTVVGNLFSSKAAFASYFGVLPREIIPLLADAI